MEKAIVGFNRQYFGEEIKLRVLIVEDDTQKYGKIHEILRSSGVSEIDIVHKPTAFQAIEETKTRHFDLMLLDINLPRRLGEGPRRGGGLEVLRELGRDDDCKRPTYVVGITAFEDLVAEFGEEFQQNLWSLIHYSENSDRWISQLRLRTEYILALNKSRNFSDGVTYGSDLAIISALDTVEFDAVKRLPCGWQPLRLSHDESRYLSGSLQQGDRTLSVIAAAAPRMGMSASAVLAAKLIHQFRPRYIAMVGICAGRRGKVQLGDVIIADPTWDWGSGKVVPDRERSKFLPAPHQLDLDAGLVSTLKDIAEDKLGLAAIKHSIAGTKPSSELAVHFGPLVSGASVMASELAFENLLDQHRGILGIEMEGYAIASAAVGSGKPRPTAMIIKGVCDFADADKNDDYQEYAANVSAKFLYEAALRFL